MGGKIEVNDFTLEKIKSFEYEQEGNINFTSIIILTYNKLEYTKMCIESIRKFTPKNQYEIIVVDNNSSDGTKEWLKKQKDLKVIYNIKNEGFPKGCNQGIKISKGESILFLNNDTIVTPNWLNNLDKLLYSSDDIGAVGGISNSCSNGQAIITNYNNFDEMIDLSILINNQNKLEYIYKTYLVGYCYLVKKSILDEIGNFDERFTPGNFEDNDLSYRIISNGYKLLLCQNSYIHHFGSVSFKLGSQEYYNTYITNLKKLNDKWKFNIVEKSFSTLETTDILNGNKNDKINILEIGCGIGATYFNMLKLYKNIEYHGIESLQEAFNISRNFFDVKNINIENEDIGFDKNYFDYILLTDKLQGYQNPISILNKIKKYLKEDGYILTSITNIMHISKVKEILFGSNNISGFTANQIQTIFRDSGYKIESMKFKQLQLQKEDMDLVDKICNITSEDLKNQYLTYEYDIKASKIEGL
ncbi:MAG: glycosyltransferase [Romboutsia sp.]|nr:glycosyltransferase [Romboutsia sp.]